MHPIISRSPPFHLQWRPRKYRRHLLAEKGGSHPKLLQLLLLILALSSYFFTALQPAMVVIFIASVGGRFSFLRTVSSTTFLVIFSNASSIWVAVCNAAGLPASPASRMLCTNGTSPKKGTSKSSAKCFAPSFPNI